MPSDTTPSEPVGQQTATPPSAPSGQPKAPTGYVENPGQTLGIIGIALNALGITIGGIILGIISRNKSKQANMSTSLGTISLVWGIVGTVLGILAVVGSILFIVLLGGLEATGQIDLSSPSSIDSQYEWQ